MEFSTSEHYVFDNFSVGELVVTYFENQKYLGIITDKFNGYMKIHWEGEANQLFYGFEEFHKFSFCKFKDFAQFEQQMKG